jgi:tRNA(Arg) A34 adenosine deaminase TadA
VVKKKKQRRNNYKNALTEVDKEISTDSRQESITIIKKLYTSTNISVLASSKHSSKVAKAQSKERPEAYLCNRLDIYLTHEPCVACSMVMVHPRFRACIFIRRMPRIRGLCAEKDNGGLRYRLFWRSELNWRVLTFQYFPRNTRLLKSKERSVTESTPEDEENFHA